MTIYCYGDSNTYGYDPRSLLGEAYPGGGWVEQLGQLWGIKLENLGMNGREIPDTPYQMSLPAKVMERCAGPAQLWVMLGTNDCLAQPRASAGEITQKMEDFLRYLLAQPACRSGRVSLRLLAPPRLGKGQWVTDPAQAETSRQLGPAYGNLARRLDIGFFDASALKLPLAYDGVHLTQEGHTLLAQALAKVPWVTAADKTR